MLPPALSPRDGDPFGVGAELGGVRYGPAQSRPSVLHRRRERVLRREPVVHGQNVRPGVAAEQTAGRIVGVQVPDDEPAPVEEHDQRMRPPGLLRRVMPRG